MHRGSVLVKLKPIQIVEVLIRDHREGGTSRWSRNHNFFVAGEKNGGKFKQPWTFDWLERNGGHTQKTSETILSRRASKNAKKQNRTEEEIFLLFDVDVVVVDVDVVVLPTNTKLTWQEFFFPRCFRCRRSQSRLSSRRDWEKERERERKKERKAEIMRKWTLEGRDREWNKLRPLKRK